MWWGTSCSCTLSLQVLACEPSLHLMTPTTSLLPKIPGYQTSAESIAVDGGGRWWRSTDRQTGPGTVSRAEQQSTQSRSSTAADRLQTRNDPSSTSSRSLAWRSKSPLDDSTDERSQSQNWERRRRVGNGSGRLHATQSKEYRGYRHTRRVVLGSSHCSPLSWPFTADNGSQSPAHIMHTCAVHRVQYHGTSHSAVEYYHSWIAKLKVLLQENLVRQSRKRITLMSPSNGVITKRSP